MRMRSIMIALAATVFAPGAALADSAMSVVGKTGPLQTGEAVYQHVCQGCHMPGGQGAVGAGARFPALASNPKLASPGYPVHVILNGYGGMPWFSGMLSDRQVADVVNYVRTHFGNHYTGSVTPEFVAAHAAHVNMERE